MLDILIPTMRPERMDSIYKNLRESTKLNFKLFFILEAEDFEHYKNLKRNYHIILNKGSKSYTGAINSAYKQVSSEYFFTGADDLVFHLNWLENAMPLLNKGCEVVGTNDLLNRYVKAGQHATHFFVKRSYIENVGGVIDNSYPVLYEYNHNYCDTEFIETAKKRGVFYPCLSSIVKHNHYTVGRSKFDSVYKKSNETKEIDKKKYEERSLLWK